MSRFSFLGGLVLLGIAGAWAEAPLPEPREEGSILLGGRSLWGTAALPSGEILVPTEDRSLAVFDPSGALVNHWQAPARFSAPVTVGPRGPLQLLAVPQLTGRVDVLVWDPLTRSLGSAFVTTRNSETVATAWGASGTVYIGWNDGHVEAWSPKGMRLWAADVSLATKHLLIDDGLGLYIFGPGRVILLDDRGQEVGEWAYGGTPRGVLQTLGGDLYCWTESGLWKQSPASDFQNWDPSGQILGVAVDRQDVLVVAEPDRIRRFAPGKGVATIRLPRPAITGPAIDDRGRVLIGTVEGMEMWAYDGRFLATLGEGRPVSAPQLGDRGQGSWGTSDWRLHLWKGFLWPAYGWPQSGGNPGRASSARRPTSLSVRSTNWADDPDFNYFLQLVSSGEESKQREVLDRFEAQGARGDLLATWPFANLILIKIARSGLTDLILAHSRVTNSWPALRLRAYALLSRSAQPEDREDLLALLHKEFDPSAAAQGAQALAHSGWDGDGQLMRLLAELQSRMIDQAGVADAVIEAARTLWQTNGRSSDPVLVPLVSAVYQGPYPRATKLKAQKFFQDLMTGP